MSFHNGSPYVQRHYLINAEETGSAWVTLYFSQDEFNSFNADMTSGFLPGAGDDENNKGNLRVYQFHGDTGSTPGDYQGASATL